MLTEKNFVPAEYVNDLVENAPRHVSTVFGNCTIVAINLPNGFTVVESSGCIDPANYSEEVGEEICIRRIKDQVWKFEGYVGANEFSQRVSSPQ